jgi:creatinine amidohydrolase
LKLEETQLKKAGQKPNEKTNYVWLDNLSTIEAKEAALAGTVVILPVGAVEEHGKHLPLCTDSMQAEYVAVEVAKRTGCLVLPPLRYGICNAGRNFPGTLTIEFDSLYRIVRDILRELTRNDFTRIIVLSGHAGSSHMIALKLAAQSMVQQSQEPGSNKKVRIMVLSDFYFADELKEKLSFSHSDGHAGAIETSRMMDINPELIKGKGEDSFSQMPRFEIVSHPEQFFPSGVMGNPTEASKNKGRTINEYVIEQVSKLVAELKEE